MMKKGKWIARVRDDEKAKKCNASAMGEGGDAMQD